MSKQIHYLQCQNCRKYKDVTTLKEGMCTRCHTDYLTKKVTNYKPKRVKAKTSESVKRMNRLNKYDLSHTDYDNLLEFQDNMCAICKSQLAKCIDHDHSNNEVRGLLCSSCNSGLGFFKDNIKSLKNAIDYLLKPTYSTYKELYKKS